jgi:hypothetical protein
MKAASITEIKKELKTRTHQELLDHCLRMAKFSKDSKELLTFLLFEADDEAEFIRNVKQQYAGEFATINNSSFYLTKKGLRKILRELKKITRYSGRKETKVELMLFFCSEMLELGRVVREYYMLSNLYEREKEAIRKTISTLHEDLQYDYNVELDKLADLS